MNGLYGIAARGSQIKVYLKTEGRQFKEKAKLFMPKCGFTETGKIALEIEIHGRWFCQNGSIRRLDLPNLEKVLIDAIAEKYLDGKDERVFQKLTKKVEAAEEAVLVKIAVLE